MKKIITLSLVLAMAASTAFAGGGTENYVDKTTPDVPSSLPKGAPILLFLIGSGTAIIIGAALNASSQSEKPKK